MESAEVLTQKLQIANNLVKALKQEIRDIKVENNMLRSQQACPILLEQRAKIASLEKQLQDRIAYERNNLLAEGKND